MDIGAYAGITFIMVSTKDTFFELGQDAWINVIASLNQQATGNRCAVSIVDAKGRIKPDTLRAHC